MPYGEVMGKFKAGTLHSGGPAGPLVHNPQQAVAIMESEKKKAAEGKQEYQSKTPSTHPLKKLKRKFQGGR